MTGFLQDLRYGFRNLAKSPGFTSVAVLTLALGIGANTAIFTVINALLLRLLPVRRAEQLVTVGDPAAVGGQSNGSPRLNLFSYPLYRELRDGQTVFSGIFASADLRRVMIRMDEPGQQ